MTAKYRCFRFSHGSLSRRSPARHHWNQAVLLQPREPLDPGLLSQALLAVIRHHDALRLRYRCNESRRMEAELRDFRQPDRRSLDSAGKHLRIDRGPSAQRHSAA